MQALLHPMGKILYAKFAFDSNAVVNLVHDETEMVAITRRIGVPISEISNIDELAIKIRNIITQEVITDLRKNAGTLLTKKLTGKEDEIYINLCEINGIIHRKTMRSGLKWIVVGPEIAKTLAKYFGCELNVETDVVKYIGPMCSTWKLYIDPSFPQNQILCGGIDTLCDGYIHSPYILLSQEGKHIDGSRGSLIRYGKKLLNNKYYARIEYD